MTVRRAARRGLEAALRSPLGGAVERGIVCAGRIAGPRLPATAALRAALRRHHGGRDLTVRLRGGLTLRVPPVPEMYALYLTGPCDQGVMRLLERLVRPGDHVLDVGANVGLHTVTAARRCGPRGHVHAFEAQRRLVPYLESSVRQNGVAGRVTIHNVAVWHVAGAELPLLSPPGRSDRIGAQSLLAHQWLDPQAAEAVRTATLDGLGLPGAAVVKLDIEGAELPALRGFERTLNESPPPFILAEVLPRRARFSSIGNGEPLERAPDSTDPAELFAHLEARGYDAFEFVASGHAGRRIRPDELPDETTNVVFARPEGRVARPWVFA